MLFRGVGQSPTSDESIDIWRCFHPRVKSAQKQLAAASVMVRFYDIQLNIKSEKGHDLQTIEVTADGCGCWWGPLRSFIRRRWYNPAELGIHSDSSCLSSQNMMIYIYICIYMTHENWWCSIFPLLSAKLLNTIRATSQNILFIPMYNVDTIKPSTMAISGS